jgi:hypothetical protein
MSSSLRETNKSFLSRPEGKVGLAISALAMGGAIYGLYWLLPILIVVATNVLELGALCAAIAVLFYAIADGRVRAFLSYLYKGFFRAVTGFFIQIDPIGILKNHIEELSEKLRTMREQLGNLNGQVRRVQQQIAQNEQLRDDALALAKAGRHDPTHADASKLQARHAIKLEDSNTRLRAIEQQMMTLFRMMKKLSDTSELVLQDMQSTVDIKTRERASIKAAYSAYRGALAILQGQSEGRDLYDRAMEFLNDDYARKLGEIELFMDFSEGVIKGADLETLAYDARATERLDEWERRLSDTLLGSASTSTTPRSPAFPEPVRVAEAHEAEPDALDRLLDTDAHDTQVRKL